MLRQYNASNLLSGHRFTASACCLSNSTGGRSFLSRCPACRECESGICEPCRYDLGLWVRGVPWNKATGLTAMNMCEE